MRSEMEVLVVEDCILFRNEQPPWQESTDWRDALELD
jgi:hypothetical protein